MVQNVKWCYFRNPSNTLYVRVNCLQLDPGPKIELVPNFFNVAALYTNKLRLKENKRLPGQNCCVWLWGVKCEYSTRKLVGSEMDEFYFKPWLSLQNKHKSTSAAANPFRLACRGIRMGEGGSNQKNNWNQNGSKLPQIFS